MRKFRADPLIFYTAVGFIVAFVALTIGFGERARDLYSTVSAWMMDNFAWLYIGGVSAVFVFLIVLFVSRFGNYRLGDDDEPEYSLPVWFSMLFAAGMGATLLFWGAAEPLHHAYNPPRGGYERMSEEAIRQAFEFTYYHFGIHMWVIFTLPGLAMGYFIYKRKMPARYSSMFSPLLGSKVYEWPGKLLDAIGIIGTVFGLAVSVGLGVLQISAGMNILWGVPLVTWVELAVIIFITTCASISVATGLDKGVKLLSNLNIIGSIVLLVFLFIVGPTLKIIEHLTESFGFYVASLPELMFWVDANNDNPGWHATWTAFYWAWTICWSPYVGMFFARISRGRTVRQFIAGTILLPTIFDIVWFATFGRTAIEVEQNDPGVLTGPVVEDGDTPQALFTLLEQYPLYFVSGAVALAVIVFYFVTSIDSAALVMDMFTTGEEEVTPKYYRVAWAVAVGIVTAALLFINDSGIQALQEVVIIIALPFFIVYFVMMFSLVKAMSDDSAAERRFRSRRWEKTDTAEKYEEAEAKPAPGYDEEGNEIDRPELEYDHEEGSWRLTENIITEAKADDETVDASVPEGTEVIIEQQVKPPERG
ncbi:MULTISPECIES: BCCT family transporter [unclassified Corynebacterium]|uniref:BCCT family transporter n=1 Tax=unclassified Corynebacterium TaxID=2624378 RepID=UPI00264C2AD5|nr:MULTISPECIES: BCCT family transporter [unclassified Corynebacterium]MDN8595452.1 BCCT family transporter [Corynebacterium sp. P4_F2]WKK56582.1 BCCT family transporter [Corynebacterium sp. P4-C1]WKK64018.1 BCCT family transporter [Corynebacterium sp. P8-C1]